MPVSPERSHRQHRGSAGQGQVCFCKAEVGCAGHGLQSTCAPTRRAYWLREELQADRTDEVGVWRVEQQLLRIVTARRRSWRRAVTTRSSYCFTSTGRRWRWGRAGRRWSDRPVPARLIGVGVPEVSVSRVSVLRFAPFGRQVAHDWRGATVERSFLSARLGVVAPARTLFWAPLMEGRGRGRGGIRLD